MFYVDKMQESIDKNGIKELKCKTSPSMTKELATTNADKIINKYCNGISYLVSNWIGNDVLELGNSFSGN